MTGPYRTPSLPPSVKLVWRHPTFRENHINGCHCTDCPGALGNDTTCRSSCPTAWWRRAWCRLFGHVRPMGEDRATLHAQNAWFGSRIRFSCQRCLQILEVV